MKKAKEMFDLCLSHDVNVSLTWQRITDWSVEIYKGYKANSYERLFYIDGEISRKKAVKKGLRFIRSYEL